MSDDETTSVEKGGKPRSAAPRAASIANTQKFLEVQRAGREAQRAAGFPSLVKGRETLRALGFPSLQKGLETQRAGRFPALQHGRETQRAAGYPALRRARETKRANAILALRKELETQLSTRKLAEDPTFVPSPLPDFESMPRIAHRRKSPTIPFPEPGCKSKLLTERTLATHILNKHTYSRYSIDTPHKCKDPSCNKYFPTTQKASIHYSKIHGTQKPQCPLCDRIYSNPSHWRKHLLLVHGIPPSSAPVSP